MKWFGKRQKYLKKFNQFFACFQDQNRKALRVFSFKSNKLMSIILHLTQSVSKIITNIFILPSLIHIGLWLRFILINEVVIVKRAPLLPFWWDIRLDTLLEKMMATNLLDAEEIWALGLNFSRQKWIRFYFLTYNSYIWLLRAMLYIFIECIRAEESIKYVSMNNRKLTA